MAFTRQTWWRSGRQALATGGTRRQVIGTALAGVILGLGSVTIGSSLVHALERGGIFDFFEELFRGPPRQEVAPTHRPGRYANLPDGRRVSSTRSLHHTPRPITNQTLGRTHRLVRRRALADARPATVAATGQSTVCVRMCDGYLFPLGILGSRNDMPVHQAACAAACPGASTTVYTLAAHETELDRAVSPQGLPYRASALANIYRQRRVPDCACRPASGAVPPLAQDATLRTGDVIATRDSADVVTKRRAGSFGLIDFRNASLTGGRSRQIEAKVGTLHRDAEARAFRKTLRTAERTVLVQVAAVGKSFRVPERPVGDLAQIRVVSPSPFLR